MIARLWDGCKIALFSFMFLGLVACHDSEHKDLKQYVKQVKKKPGEMAPPLPKRETGVVHEYKAHKLKSPFDWRTTRTEGPVDLSRPPLERYPLDGFLLVGVLESGDAQWALIYAPNDQVYKAKIGDLMGEQQAVVTHMQADGIELKSAHPEAVYILKVGQELREKG